MITFERNPIRFTYRVAGAVVDDGHVPVHLSEPHALVTVPPALRRSTVGHVLDDRAPGPRLIHRRHSLANLDELPQSPSYSQSAPHAVPAPDALVVPVDSAITAT